MNRFKLVGEGDDAVSHWHPPISDFPAVFTAFDDLHSQGSTFPIIELVSYLVQRGVLAQAPKDCSVTCVEDVFEIILSPNFRLEFENWGGDSPGQSGVYVRAYVDTANLDVVTTILNLSDTFLKAFDKRSRTEAANRSASPDESVAGGFSESLGAIKENDGARLWEDRLFEELVLAINESRSLIRLNFLVDESSVFFLSGHWWHSLGGSPENVAARLRQCAFNVIDCKVTATSRGWIPHFARQSEEEDGIGWREDTLEVACPEMWKPQLELARRRILLCEAGKIQRPNASY